MIAMKNPKIFDTRNSMDIGQNMIPPSWLKGVWGDARKVTVWPLKEETPCTNVLPTQLKAQITKM